jgi:hypothetical protein
MWQLVNFDIHLSDSRLTRVSVHLIPQGAILYRGSSLSTSEPSSDSSSLDLSESLWFTPDPTSAAIYGYVHAVRVTHPITLLNMDNLHTRNVTDTFYRQWARKHNKNPDLVSNVYPVQENRVVRDSSFSEDTLLTRWFTVLSLDSTMDLFPLQSVLHPIPHPLLAFDGFGSLELKGVAQHQVHHAEVWIRDPSQRVRVSPSDDPVTRVTSRQMLDYRYKALEKREAQRRAERALEQKEQVARDVLSLKCRKLSFD